MQRTKVTSDQTAYFSLSLPHSIRTRSLLEDNLLAFLDSFDIHRFFCDLAYRRRLNAILERFTDEEFENFERMHSHRFTMN